MCEENDVFVSPQFAFDILVRLTIPPHLLPQFSAKYNQQINHEKVMEVTDKKAIIAWVVIKPEIVFAVLFLFKGKVFLDWKTNNDF